MPTENAEQIPIIVAGSSTFGVWPKVSLEKTYNMYLSDEWMIGFPGYKEVALSAAPGEGRAIFRSVRGGFLLAVVGSAVYILNQSITPTFVGTLSSSSGEVFIDENLSQQICLVDGTKAYIYHYDVSNPSAIGTLTPQTNLVDGMSNIIIPNYVSFHAGFFLIASSSNSPNSFQWYAFVRNSDTTILWFSTQTISTKPDDAIAVRRLPGRSNNVIVFGSSVCEIHTLTGAQVEVAETGTYVRVSSYSIDNGCASVSTIAASEETVVWLAVNESNSPVIMVTNGAETKQISTDGIDHLMETIKFPDQSTAFFSRQNGHLFYQLTFFNPQYNLTLAYDFTTNKFFHLSDENLNFHIARDVVYFNKQSYMISLNNAAIYEIGDQFNTYSYTEDPSDLGFLIPRIRICNTIRKKDSSTFRCGLFTFWIEQGVNDYFEESVCNGELITEITEDNIVSESGLIMLAEFGSCNFIINAPAVDMSFSKTGNENFSNFVRRELQPMSHFRNQIRWHRIGQANELTVQLRFWNFNRMVVSNGVAEVY
jgi:hypothetical protein